MIVIYSSMHLGFVQLPLALCADSWYDGYSVRAWSLSIKA